LGTITVEKADNIMIFNGCGDLSFDDISQAIREHYPSVTFHVIWDLTEGRIDGISTEQFRNIPLVAKECLVNRVGGKTAYVSSVNHNFGLLRMYTALAEIAGLPYGYNVFKSIAEAKVWLQASE